MQQIKTTGAIKATHVLCGNNIINLTGADRIKIQDHTGSSIYFEPKTKSSDLLIDINQLEGKTLQNFKIVNLLTDSIVTDLGEDVLEIVR